MPEQCEHCGREIKAHTPNWWWYPQGDSRRPSEDGDGWGFARLWIEEKLAGIMCMTCYSAGKKFKRTKEKDK